MMKNEFFYLCFASFFLFAFSLFSSEENKTGFSLKRNDVKDIDISSSLLNIPSNSIENLNPPLQDNTSGNKEADLNEQSNTFQKEEKEVASGKKNNNENTDKVDSNVDKTDTGKKEEDLEFASIQVSGLTVANGDEWYFEEYDESGNVIGTISYAKEKMLSKSSIEYNDGKRIKATFIEPKKIIKVSYDEKGAEIAREEFKNRKGDIGKSLLSYGNIYDENGRIKEEVKVENGLEIRKVYTYENEKRTTEAIYENGVKTIFVEYKASSKIVHIFDGETEVSVFEEEIEH